MFRHGPGFKLGVRFDGPDFSTPFRHGPDELEHPLLEASDVDVGFFVGGDGFGRSGCLYPGEKVSQVEHGGILVLVLVIPVGGVAIALTGCGFSVRQASGVLGACFLGIRRVLVDGTCLALVGDVLAIRVILVMDFVARVLVDVESLAFGFWLGDRGLRGGPAAKRGVWLGGRTVVLGKEAVVGGGGAGGGGTVGGSRRMVILDK